MSDLREALEAAYDAAEQEQEGRPAADTPEPVRAEAPATEAREEAGDRGDGRDAQGRFAGNKSLAEARAESETGAADRGKPERADGAPAAAGDGDAAEPPVEKDPYSKAPASWKPAAREHWQSIPADVRGEIHRREREAAQVMQQTTEARHVHQALSSLSHKYAATMAAEGGVDILTATDNLAQIATRLRFGAPAEKASTIANLIQTYGVDIMALDNLLAGLPAQPAAAQQAQYRDPRLDKLLAEAEQVKQAREEQLVQSSVAEVEQFGSDKEFFGDVRGMMADMIEVAARQGFELSLQDAYDRAVQIHPEIGKIVAQRAHAEAARNPNRSTAKARAAASSVKGSPSGGPARAAGGSIRDDILSSIEEVGGR